MISEKDRSKIESLAKKHQKRGRFEDAIIEYQKLLTGDDQDVMVRNIIGDLYVKLNQFKRASEQFRRAADFYEKKGLESKCIALHKKIAKISPDNIESLGKLGDFYRDKGFIPEAKNEYQRQIDCLKKKGMIKNAVSTFEKLLALDRENSDYQTELAELYEKDDQLDAALRMLNEAAERKIRENAIGEAKPLLKRARKIRPDDVRTITNIVNILLEEKRFDQAVTLVRDLTDEHDDNMELLSILGRIYYESGKLEEADGIYSRLIEDNPKDGEARLNKGRILVKKKEHDRAFEVMEPLIDSMIIRKKYDRAIGILGLILLENHTHFFSLRKLFKVVKNRGEIPELDTVARLLFREYEKRGLDEESVPVLEALTQLHPENKDFQSRLENLSGKYHSEEAPAAEEEPFGKPHDTPETNDILQTSLEQVGIYIAEERFREAKKYFDQLQLNYEGNPLIEQKKMELADVFARAEEGASQSEKPEAESPADKDVPEDVDIDSADIPSETEPEAEQPAAEDGEQGDAEFGSWVTSAVEIPEAETPAEEPEAESPVEDDVLEDVEIDSTDIPSETTPEEGQPTAGDEEKGEVELASWLATPAEEQDAESPADEDVLEDVEIDSTDIPSETTPEEEPPAGEDEEREDEELDSWLAAPAEEQETEPPADDNVLEEVDIDATDIPSETAPEEEPPAAEDEEREDEELDSWLAAPEEEQETEPPEEEDDLGDVEKGSKVTAADIFAGTDIIPIETKESRWIFYDLNKNIREELDSLKRIYTTQSNAGKEAHERKLKEIVSQFRKGIESKFGKEKPENHYNLGIAYLNQDLLDEAIEEFKLAAEEDRLKLDTFSYLSLCFRKKWVPDEALVWIDKALELAEEGTSQFFALLYDKAQIFYGQEDMENARILFERIDRWDPDFREVSYFMGILKNPEDSPEKG